MTRSNEEWDALLRESRRSRWWLWLVVAVLAAFIVSVMALYAFTAQAHMKERPSLDQWLMTLYSNGRGPCCDNSEAETMADPDWRNASEMKKDECTPSSSVTTPNDPVVFCVRLENPDVPGDWKWWTVPKAAVVELPNMAGPALIWLIWNNRGTPDAQPYIRCFLAGTLS